MILSLQEEGLAARWLIITGIIVFIGSIMVEAIMGFLQGGMGIVMVLDFPCMVWYFGWLLIIIGAFFLIKNFIFSPSERNKVSEYFRIKVFFATGILFLLIAAGLRLFLGCFKTGCLSGIMLFTMSLSFPRLCMLIGAGIFFIGILMSIKYLSGLFFKFLWPFGKKRYN